LDQATTVSTSALTCRTCSLFGHGCAQINPDRFVENCTDYITDAAPIPAIDYVGVNEHAEAKSEPYVCDYCSRKGHCGIVPDIDGTCAYGPSADDLRDMEHMKNLLNNVTSMVHSVEKESEPDMVNHPNHYTQGGIECIKAIEASMPPDGFQDYCKGNVLKYVWRFRQKNGLEDLKKARVYLNWMIESVEKEQENNGSL